MSDFPAYIFAFNGVRLRKFVLDKPTFDIEEIAWALSMQCRFTGHVRRFYSVAEHSLLVSNLIRYLSVGDPFEGLMHDAHEAYITDLASPWKAVLPDYKQVENRLEKHLREWSRLAAEKSAPCKHADRLALYIEAQHLMPDGAVDELTIGDEAFKSQAASLFHLFKPSCYAPERAREQFLFQYERLRR